MKTLAPVTACALDDGDAAGVGVIDGAQVEELFGAVLQESEEGALESVDDDGKQLAVGVPNTIDF